jgi:hypothetical protein
MIITPRMGWCAVLVFFFSICLVSRTAANDPFVLLSQEGKFFAFPGLARLKDGTLIVVAREGLHHIDPFGKVIQIRSETGGKTWSGPLLVYDSPLDDRDPSVTMLQDGTVVVTFGSVTSWVGEGEYTKKLFGSYIKSIPDEDINRYRGYFLLRSYDKGATWESKSVKTPVFGVHGIYEDKLGPLFYAGITRNRSDGRTYVDLVKSDDKGENWDLVSTVVSSKTWVPNPDWEFYDEPAMVMLPDGRILIALRVDRDGYLRFCISSDRGKTWTSPRKSGLLSYSPAFLLITRKGELLIVYGSRTDPYSIRAALVTDMDAFLHAGKVEKEYLIDRYPSPVDLGYPVAVELEQGEVFIVYYVGGRLMGSFLRLN